MPLPDSGIMTTEMIRAEFGGDRPFDMRNYYAGGAHVPAGTTGKGGHPVPASGKIAHSDFYGTSNYKPGSITFDTAGVHYWQAPAYVKKIHVVGIGGGAAGGGVCGNGDCKDQMGAGGGGSSGVFMNGADYNVTGGATYTVRVGAGGQGVQNATGQGGGATGIDGLFSVGGGNGGGGGPCCSYHQDGDFKAGGSVAGGNSGGKGYNSGGYHGGTGGAGWGGGGGGAGGNSYQNGNDGTSFGAGGGGGGIGGAGNVRGGAGKNGFITISW